MIIGHLPAGYLLSRGARRIGMDGAVSFGILIGSVLPDLDMLRFWLLDGGAVHHHTYLTHRPVLWLVVTLIGFALGRRVLTGIGVGALLHIVLDSIVGAIAWGWPVFDRGSPLVVVPATQDHWVMSFLLHWTFAVEIAVCFVAAFVFVRLRLRAAA